MATIDDALRTQIRNIEQSTGRSMADWTALVESSGKAKHGEVLAWLKTEHGLTHGNANLLALKVREAAAGGAPSRTDLVDSHYSGKNAPLRPLYDPLMAAAGDRGPDIEVAPKKTYVSLRRKKQFATAGPAAGQLEVCLNLPGQATTERLRLTSGMATHKVRIAEAAELDQELLGWLAEAYERAG